MSQRFLLFCHRWSLIICSIHMKMCHCSANLHWLLLFKKKGKLFPRKVFSNPFVTHDNNPTVITDLSKSFCQFKKCVILSFAIFIGGKISKENLIFFSNVLKMNEIFVLKMIQVYGQYFCSFVGLGRKSKFFSRFCFLQWEMSNNSQVWAVLCLRGFLKLWKNKRVKKKPCC